MAAELLRTAFRRSERIVARRIAGEYVLVPIVGRGAEVDSIFTLNRVGAFIWGQLDGARTGDRIVEAVADAFEVEAARAAEDYCEFVTKLKSIRAVAEVESR